MDLHCDGDANYYAVFIVKDLKEYWVSEISAVGGERKSQTQTLKTAKSTKDTRELHSVLWEIIES